MCKNTTFPHNTKIMMPRACKRLPPAPLHPSDGGIPEGGKDIRHPRPGCTPSSPGIGSIMTDDRADHFPSLKNRRQPPPRHVLTMPHDKVFP